MANKMTLTAILLCSLFLSGCGGILSPRDNLSPQLEQQFENTNGKISGLQTDQQAMKIELARITQEIGEVRDMQQGILNMQANNNNENGIQILQGSGSLILIFGLITIGMLLYYFYKSKSNEKTAKILAQQIKLRGDPDLQERVMSAAINTDVEKQIYELIK